ncbi:UNVERIFIED_CONTAM: hypothetical protein Q9R71_25480 [Actinomycetes bacterium ARC8]|uniref:hypothetical protein n=1 Tax=Pseudarthrobacter oxydans TaxID=1671 RepID=UPI0029377A6F|nr:hypothetical protein [Actinomycetes bacterium ARC8]
MMSSDPDFIEVQGHRAWVGTTPEGEAAIGRIAIWAASVEENLVHLCSRLINIDDHEIGYAVTANMNASAVIDLARRLVIDSKTTSDEDRADVMAMLTEAKAALVERNRILHASLGELMLGGKMLFRSRRKKGPVPDGENPRWESTLRGLDELDAVGARLFNVSEDLWAYVHLPSD